MKTTEKVSGKPGAKIKSVLKKVFRFRKAAKSKPRKRGDTVGTINRDKDLSDRFCTHPFDQFEILEDGRVFCCCSAWLNKSLGNVKEKSPAEIWNSEAAQDIRRSIHDGSYKYCNHKLCPLIQNGELPRLDVKKKDPRYSTIIEQKSTHLDSLPNVINLTNDASCNLSCPSCRTQKMLFNTGDEFNKRFAIQDKIVRSFFSEPTDRHFTVNVTGSGDPFASKVFRDFLFDLNGADFPNMNVHLQTNGVLFTEKNWDKLHKIHDNLKVVLISFDAATPETYQITRRGGNWDMLLENFSFLAKKRDEGKFNFLRADFVVQADNYREMPAFVKLVKALGASRVTFSMVTDWGTWSKEVYETKCIWKQTHPDFDDFIRVLRDPIFADPLVDMGNVTEYRAKAIEKAA